MTDEELVMHYLRGFAGVEMDFCRTLNRLARIQTGHDRLRNRVPRAVIDQKWRDLRRTANRLIMAQMIKRKRGPRPQRRMTIRINEAYVRNPFYR